MTTLPVTQEPIAEHDLARAYEAMLLIRKFEEQSAALRAAGQSPSMCTSVGQEAGAVGVVAALEPHDYILTNHRSAGHLLARGADPGRLLAEIMGKSTGYCGGKSGSLHVSVRELGVVLTSTIVGGELSLATGVGLSQAMSDSDAVVVCFFGDGAACEGIFHESLNLAAVWNLPILYVCENNQWQAFVHRRETMLVDHVADWARPYGVETRTVDGNDVEVVFDAATEAVAHIRKTRKPYFLETYTYRLRGHMEPDDQKYVDVTELESWRARDPLTLAEERLRDAGLGNEIEAIAFRVQQRIEQAASFALESDWPSFDEITTGVYA